MTPKVKTGFELNTVTIPLSAICPIRQILPRDKAFGKYRSILTSIKEVGIIEPLVVFPLRGSPGIYQLLDGHLRLKALNELGRSETTCLVATDDDAFTYNDKVSRIALIQEHAMIVKAIDQGLTAAQIAKALAVDIAKVRASVNLIEGIHSDAVDLLKTKPISAAALRLFRRVKSMRQVDMAQLMVSSNNFTFAYAKALIIGTPQDQLVGSTKMKPTRNIPEEDILRMEKEMETIEREYRSHESRFGENALHLNAALRHVKRLLENPKIKRFLGNRYPEILEELQDFAAIESI